MFSLLTCFTFIGIINYYPAAAAITLYYCSTITAIIATTCGYSMFVTHAAVTYMITLITFTHLNPF